MDPLKKTKSKDLLRIDNKYFNQDNNDQKSMLINKLINNPAQKPNFYEIQKSNILCDIKTFLPQFQQDTLELLNDQNRIQKQKIEDDETPIFEPGDEIENESSETSSESEEDEQIDENQLIKEIHENNLKNEEQTNNNNKLVSIDTSFEEEDEQTSNQDSNQEKMIEMNLYMGIFDLHSKEEKNENNLIIPKINNK